jgi:predicted metalloprotease with PDZ domain
MQNTNPAHASMQRRNLVGVRLAHSVRTNLELSLMKQLFLSVVRSIISIFTVSVGCVSAYGQAPVTLTVDLRDAPRKLLHATEIIPIRPGPMTLAYPRRLGNEHKPGPIGQQAGLFITAHQDGLPTAIRIPWDRDPLDLYLYHIKIPRGVTSIEVKTDFITSAIDGIGAGSTDANIAVLNWNTVLLYPYTGPSTQVASIEVTPTIILPEDWHFATALVPNTPSAAPLSGSTVAFQTVSLEQLVDSPLISGRYFREVALAPEITPKHYLDMVADEPESLEISEAHIDQLSNLVRQTGALFRSRHYNSFRMLVTLSDYISGNAFDHHQCLDNRRPANFLTNERSLTLYGNFIVHDFVHSWNGQYRRPVGLATPNYQVPIDTSELWVYEGLTDYLSAVLAVRSGIWTRGQFLDQFAEIAAKFNHRPGKMWRDLQDTATMAPILWSVDSSPAYESWRLGGFDFYGEGELIWLEVDAIIRNETDDRKSLDDFLALFYGVGGNTGPNVVPFTFAQLVKALNTVTPYNWAGFFNHHLHELTPTAPLGGITGSGYRLIYRNTPSAWTALKGDKDFAYSIDMDVRPDGTISDVHIGSPAQTAGFGPGMKLLTVNGHPFSIDGLQEAIRDAKDTTAPIECTVANTGVITTLELPYHAGERYPALERLPGTVDRFLEIAAPK